MRKILILAYLLAATSMLFAQLPEGKLFSIIFRQGAGQFHKLGYVSLPANNYEFIDSVRALDLTEHENALYTIGYEGLKQYTGSQLTLQNHIDGFAGIEIKGWDNYIIVSSHRPPYLRAFDIAQNLAPDFVIDTPILRTSFQNLTISGDIAFIHSSDTVVIFDLRQQQLIKKLSVDNAHKSRYEFSVSAKNGIYLVYSEYSIPSKRGIIFFDTATMQLDTILEASSFILGNNQIYFDNDRLYNWNYSSYYDLQQDTLIMNQDIRQYPIAFEKHNDQVITQILEHENSQVSTLISYYNGNNLLDTLRINGGTFKTHWVSKHRLSTDIDPLNKSIEVKLFPNPATEEIRVSSPQISEINVFDVSGKMLTSRNLEIATDNVDLDVSNLSSGIYFIQLTTNNGILVEQFIKE